MKGEARPSWTEGRQRWLRRLRDDGASKPKGVGEGSVATYCRALGWTAIRPPLGHVITADGLAALERWDAGDLGLVPKRPAHQRPCPVKIEAPAPVMREGAPTECTATPAPGCELAKLATAAAPFGGVPREAPSARQDTLTPSLGLVTTPAGFSACLACGGKGRGRYNWPCQACNGSGRIRRTVEP